MKALTDGDPMPFGVHKGAPMRDVPATYLDWLRGQPWLSQWPAVAEYIEQNTHVIDWEFKRSGALE